MKVCHLVVIVLNGYLGPTRNHLIHGSHDAKERPRPDYLAKRVPILKRYTLRSLALQTTQDFQVLVLHDHRLAPELGELAPALRGRTHLVGIDPIDFKRDLSDAFWKPRAAEDRKIDELAGDASILLLTYIDSDDCYRFDALARFRKEWDQHQHFGALMLRDGYIHDTVTGTVAHYRADSPPFYTLVYHLTDYRKGRRYVGGPGHHGSVARMIPTRYVPGGPLYMVNVHRSNDSTKFRASRVLRPEEASVVRGRFGIIERADLPA